MQLSCVSTSDSAHLAHHIRLRTLEMIHRAKSSHIGSSFSMADLLAVLYTNILRVDPKRPELSELDRFILIKGYACSALYVVLSESGLFYVLWSSVTS